MGVAPAPWLLRLCIYLLCSFFILSALAACGGPSSLTQTYSGNGFSISYPSDWTTTTVNGVTGFLNSDKSEVLNVPVVDNSAATSIDDAFSKVIAAKNLKDAQDAQPDSPTATIGGETWQQKAVTGTNSDGLKVMYEISVTSHPANAPTAKWFVITREASTDNFSQANTDYFQRMVATFKFTA